MSLFQPSVVKRHLRKLDKETLETAWQKFTTHFHNPAIQANIRKAKEEQYQDPTTEDQDQTFLIIIDKYQLIMDFLSFASSA